MSGMVGILIGVNLVNLTLLLIYPCPVPNIRLHPNN